MRPKSATPEPEDSLPSTEVGIADADFDGVAGARRVPRGLRDPFEQRRIVFDQPICIDRQLRLKLSEQPLVQIAPPRLDARVCLIGRLDHEMVTPTLRCRMFSFLERLSCKT